MEKNEDGLVKAESSLKRPLKILASSTAETSTILEKLTMLQFTPLEKSSRSFIKLKKLYQNMFLIAASTGMSTEIELNKEALNFFKPLTVLNSQIFTNSICERKKVEVSVSLAVVTYLMHGSIFWKEALKPSGLVSTVLSTLDIVNTNTL